MVHEKITGEVTASFRNEFINLSGLEAEIQKHFESLKLKRTNLKNGELLVYKETDVKRSAEGIVHLSCIKGTYALYLYLNDHPDTDSKFKARTIAPVGIMRTSDDYFVFGVMGEQTSLPGKILSPGGAIDLRDVEGERVNILGCMKRELGEEVGLNIDHDLTSLSPFSFYISEERHALTIIYNTHLALDKKQLGESFSKYTNKLKENKKEPELSGLVIIPNDSRELSEFYKKPNVIDYIPGAMGILTSN